MILDRILCMLLASFALAAVITAVVIPRTGVPPLLGFAALALAGLLWLFRKTVRESRS